MERRRYGYDATRCAPKTPVLGLRRVLSLLRNNFEARLARFAANDAISAGFLVVVFQLFAFYLSFSLAPVQTVPVETRNRLLAARFILYVLYAAVPVPLGVVFEHTAAAGAGGGGRFSFPGTKTGVKLWTKVFLPRSCRRNF